MFKMNASMEIPIEKLMVWRAGGWVKYDTKTCNLTLRLICDQLFISSDEKIIESLNVNGKIKGIYKGDVLLLIIGSTKQEIRKIKFQIKSELGQNLKALSKRFPVLNHNSSEQTDTNNVISPRYRNIEDIIKCSVEAIERQEGASVPLPHNFANFVNLCLLDPQFPSLVNETRKLLENEFEK